MNNLIADTKKIANETTQKPINTISQNHSISKSTLIVINNEYSQQKTYDIINIALLYCSLNIPCALFIKSDIVDKINQLTTNNPQRNIHIADQLRQSFSLLTEFNIDLYSDKEVNLINNKMSCCELKNLTNKFEQYYLFEL